MTLSLLLPAALAFIMFSLGLSLTLADFSRVFRRPGAMAAGLAGQMVLLPVLAWGIALGMGLAPDMALGLVLLAACPGGVSSALITHLARGETALSISLTAVTSVAAVFSVPFVLDLAMRRFIGGGVNLALPVGDIVGSVFLLTTVPVALGMAVRAWLPSMARFLENPCGRVSTVFFIIIVVATFLGQREPILTHLPSVGPAALALSTLVMGLSFAGSAMFGLSRRDCIAVATECGLQNAALGIFIATSVLKSPGMAAPSVVYALVMNVVALAFVFLMRRRTDDFAVALP